MCTCLTRRVTLTDHKSQRCKYFTVLPEPQNNPYYSYDVTEVDFVQGIKNTRYDGAQILESQHGKSENSIVT